MQKTAHSHVPLDTAGFAHPASNVLHFNITPGMQVADFGAGSGHYIAPIAEAIGESGRLFAIDVQQDLLKRLHNDAHKRGYKNVRIMWADLEKPKASRLADQTIDLVLISNLLFQVDDKTAVMREARRILKPNGTLIIIDWTDSFNMMGPHKKSVVTKPAGRELAEQNGFEFVREFNAGAHHWGLIAKPRA